MWSGEVTHRRRGHGVKHAGDVEHDSGRVLRPEQRNTSSMFHVLEKHVVVQREAETKNSEGRAADQKNSEQRKADTKKNDQHCGIDGQSRDELVRRRDCQCADTPPPSLLKRLIQEEGGAADTRRGRCS